MDSSDALHPYTELNKHLCRKFFIRIIGLCFPTACKQHASCEITSRWGPPQIASPTGHAVGSALAAQEDWLVPTIVQLELATWLTPESQRGQGRSGGCVYPNVRRGAAGQEDRLLAADMCDRHRLVTADAIVHATAVEHGADRLTCDGHFDGLPGVTFIPEMGR